jgi:hypothetical protein
MNMMNITNINDKTAVTMMIYISILILCISIGLFAYYYTLQKRLCNNMDALYGDLNGKIRSIDYNLEAYKHRLKDYYIKTAYNCCSGGNYSNSYVDTCILKDLIKQGVRGFDFEIFSIDDEPVISTTTDDSNNYHNKETFNYVKFSEAIKIVDEYAFDNSTCPNPTDPVIFHFRIKSNNNAMYENFAKILEKYTEKRLLDKTYSYECQGKNFGNTPLKDLQSKISIIVDKSNPSYMDTQQFYEYVNMTSNSIFMRALHYYDIKYTPDINELIEANKLGMTIGMPDKGNNPDNPSGIVMKEMGCQMLAMRYQLYDEFIQENNMFFDIKGFAFVLKPERLRQKNIELPAPPEQNPELSYATKDISSDFYSFEI